ncbi:MAG: helix-turn-helix transcriptional regulator [Clostridia bacterium]|nr:helix-turn-helix transcriptional regulator [Clostridia bacterium]
MLRNCLCGTNTGHAVGFIHKTLSAPHHVILHFKTPFFCIINGKRIEGMPGDCLIQQKGDTVIHGPLSENEQFINDWIYFDSDEELHNLPINTIINTENGGEIGDLIEYIIREENARDEHPKRLISDSIYKMLVILMRAADKSVEEISPEKLRFAEARSYILAHSTERWTLAKMAEYAGYSVSRFCAIYNDYFNKSPMDELLDKRLDIAKRLLSLNVDKIGDVAAMCGFSSVHYFSRFFKNRTGLSPSNYKRKN